MGKILFPSKYFACLFFHCLLILPIYGFRVVIDPGHGGRYNDPDSLYGDKYDPISERFLEGYRPGASVHGLNEFEDVYEISLFVKEYLDLTNSQEGRQAFFDILKKYDPKSPFPSESIEAILSREPGYRDRYWETDYDTNRDYRLYDHQDLRDKHLIKGVISRINSFKPELVVSIHLTGGNPGKYGGMSAVITPGYDTYKIAYDYSRATIDNRTKIKKIFESSSYSDWFISHHGRSSFEWFLCDAWIYFTGYWSQADGLEPDSTMFRGYRQNLVTWNYQDSEWMQSATHHYQNTPYSTQLKYFYPQGRFWDREMDNPERWRRENGPQGHGGDNFYASEEILRFIRKGLLIHNLYSRWNLPPIVKPYISTWSVPTYVNAISAYLELAYLDNPHDYNRIYRYKKEHAEAIAVGIYSLFVGTSKNESFPKMIDHPWGEPLQLSKYKHYNGQNYFNIVSD